MPNPILERIERLTHAEKIRHWATAKPWQGFNLKALSKPFPFHRVHVDDHGNITRMPELIGRPCFGQPTAFLRHGGGGFVFSPRTKTWVQDRCGRCPASKACALVAKKRLRATPAIDAAHSEWEELGGRDQTWPKTGRPGTAAIAFRKLSNLLQTEVEFTSSNDARVIAFYDNVAEQRRAADAMRKKRDRCKERLARAAAGDFPHEVVVVLEGEAKAREVAHRAASKHPHAPSRLKRTEPPAAVLDARVWLARTRLQLQEKATNDSAVAAEIHRLGYETHRSHGALRDAVKRSLDRIAFLERTKLEGQSAPIWARFTRADLKAALSAYPLQDLGDD